MRNSKTSKQTIVISIIAVLTIINTILIGVIFFIQSNKFWSTDYITENHTKRIINLEKTIKNSKIILIKRRHPLVVADARF